MRGKGSIGEEEVGDKRKGKGFGGGGGEGGEKRTKKYSGGDKRQKSHWPFRSSMISP